MTDVASAKAAIEEILEQGEGPRGHWRNAHFGQFVSILDEYQRLRAANPEFDPVRPVLAANVRPHEYRDDVPLITDPLTARVTDLFNVGYEVLLQILERYFAHTDETDAQLTVLADATIALMQQVIRPLGDLIPTLPAGPEHPGRTAGPSFELFYESDYLLPHREAAWTLLAERLDVAAGLCGELCTSQGGGVGGQLGPVLDALRQVAASLAAHLPPGRPQAAIDASEPLSEPDIDAMAARCAAVLSALPAAADTAQVTAAAAGITAALRPAGARSARPSGAGTGAAAAAGRLWDAALAATQLRARLGTSGDCPPELAEATARLQDLALALIPATTRPARLAELWQAQASLPAGIQAAGNGPYLATNIPALVDHLGIATRPAPQLALCRCGASAAKPACDGTCHSNGFSDARDPKRVPDQRDTYRGQQVTIFDNRGICQHSGYCTDRLPAVFRTDAEPFVAPSGGRMDEIIRAVRDCPSGALSYALGGHEARGHVDWDHARGPAIEVTADGPYRVTGAVPLTGADGEPAARAQGASAEHYALCRCGHSRNKPFCSGMHWYVGFRDPLPRPSPSLFEWAGGLGPLTRTARLLYEKHVPADSLLAPAFATMPADQPHRLAAWLAAALGGPEQDGAGQARCRPARASQHGQPSQPPPSCRPAARR